MTAEAISPHMSVTVPIRTVSESNSREHWAKRAKRAKAQRGAVVLTLRSVTLGEVRNRWIYEACMLRGLVVTLTRIAPRALDDDNLRGALKAVRDGVADWLGLASDRDPRITWQYSQERGVPHEYAVRVDIV